MGQNIKVPFFVTVSKVFTEPESRPGHGGKRTKGFYLQGETTQGKQRQSSRPAENSNQHPGTDGQAQPT